MKHIQAEKHIAPTRQSLLRWRLASLILVICTIFCLDGGPSFSQAEVKRLTLYTGQTTFSVPVFDRNGIEYVGLVEVLEPMGAVSARVDGSKWKLRFRSIEAQFEISKTKAKVHGKNTELSAPLIVDNDHGLVPLNSLKSLLPLFDLSGVDVHEGARRIFIGVPVVHVSARKTDSGKISFAFSAPVNPSIATEPGKLRMFFSREPLQSEVKSFAFDDKIIQSATYFEANGSAELTVNGSGSMAATFSDDRKVITISAVQSSTPPLHGTGPTTDANTGMPGPQHVNEQPKPHPFVVIDAAHGGSDRGAAIDTKIAEKEVTLSLAHRLRHELETRGVGAVLVRDGDSNLTADQRASIANASGAALYVSLHASGVGSGVHVFFSNIPSESRSALAFVPVQMVQASRVTQSRTVAAAMSQLLTARALGKGALPASILPLNSVAIPAVSVEVGPAQGSVGELSSASYQQSVAAGLAASVAALHAQGGPR